MVLILSVSLTSCVTLANYIGDRFTPTDQVDVYYATRDVKVDYYVIGHISAPTGMNDEQSKQLIVKKAKSVGADGVIILGIDYTGGKDSSPYNKAEVIRYGE